jgi:hypothetical protein
VNTEEIISICVQGVKRSELNFQELADVEARRDIGGCPTVPIGAIGIVS